MQRSFRTIGTVANLTAMRHNQRMDITAAQCRAARALIRMQQADLAEKSRVSLRTINHFESEARNPVPATLDAIRRALEAAGVTFTEYGVELLPRGEE